MSAAIWALGQSDNPMTETRTDPTPMTTDTPATHTLTWRPSPEASRKALSAFGVGAALIGLIGFSVSFWSVAVAARPYMGAASWTLPLLVDLAIFVLSGVALFLELHEISSKWIRSIPLALAGFTVYLNVATQHSVFGKAVHAAGPLLWVTVVEIATFTVRRLVGLSSDSAMDKVRASRWLLAPLSTFRLWRRMRLWEITSYAEAVGREHGLNASRALLRQWYGRAWRGKAPRAERLAVALQGTSDRPVADVLTEASAGIMAAANAARKPSDSASGNGSDTGSDPASETDSQAAKSGQAPARNRTGGRPETGHKTRAKVATIAAKNPDATVEQLAKKAKVSARTVRRYLPTTLPSPGSPVVEPVTHVTGVAA
jgi:hypothetical protein